MRMEPHRLGIDGDGMAEIEIGGKVAVMEMDAHAGALGSRRSGGRIAQ